MRAWFFLGTVVALAIGCDGAATSGTGPSSSATGSGGGSSLAGELAGSWTMERATCGGVEGALYDGHRLVLTFDGEALGVALDKPSCIATAPMSVSYDDAARSIDTTPAGPIDCVPADCSELCGQDAAVIPSVAGKVLLEGSAGMSLESSDEASLGVFACQQIELGAPALEIFRRGMPHRDPFDPAAIDASVCDPIDPLAPERTVYYVAQGEPGADNDACDGRAPVDEGGGHCPFLDFSSERVRDTLFRDADGTVGVHSVTVVVRAGVYAIEPMGTAPDLRGLWIHGDGQSPAEAVVLMGAPGEAVTLDGSCSPALPGCDAPDDPGRIWELSSMRGRFVRVEGLTFDNVHKWNITVHAHSSCILDNTFVGSYGADSDSVKSGTSGPHVIVRGNEFHTAFEQAIDGTGARGWLIEDNDIHDAPDRGIGFKYGASGNVVRNNRFFDLGGYALSLGGGSSAHTFPHEATNLVAEGNHASNLGGGFVEVFACSGCRANDNVVEGVLVGLRLWGDDDPSGCPGGCALTRDFSWMQNRLRGLAGVVDPDPEMNVPPNVFASVEDAAIEGFAAGDNLYCLEPGNAGLFALEGALLDHDAWSAALMTDASSSLAAGTSASCTGW